MISLPTKILVGDFVLCKQSFKDWDLEDLQNYLKKARPRVFLDIKGDSLILELDTSCIGVEFRENILYLDINYFNTKTKIILQFESGFPHFDQGGKFSAKFVDIF